MVDSINPTQIQAVTDKTDQATQNSGDLTKFAAAAQKSVDSLSGILPQEQQESLKAQISLISNPSTTATAAAGIAGFAGLSLIWAISAAYEYAYDSEDNKVDALEDDMTLNQNEQTALSNSAVYQQALENGGTISADQWEITAITTYNDEGLETLDEQLKNLDPPSDLGSLINSIQTGEPPLTDAQQNLLDTQYLDAMSAMSTNFPTDATSFTSETGLETTSLPTSGTVTFSDTSETATTGLTSNWESRNESLSTEFSNAFTQTMSAQLTEYSTMVSTLSSTFANLLSSMYSAAIAVSSNVS